MGLEFVVCVIVAAMFGFGGASINEQKKYDELHPKTWVGEQLEPPTKLENVK